jgi:hypothetical protein
MIRINDVLDFVVGATWDLRSAGVAVGLQDFIACIGAHTQQNTKECYKTCNQTGKISSRL